MRSQKEHYHSQKWSLQAGRRGSGDLCGSCGEGGWTHSEAWSVAKHCWQRASEGNGTTQRVQMLSEGLQSRAWSKAGRKGKALREELRGKDREEKQGCIGEW